jgi:hypothetical protein
MSKAYPDEFVEATKDVFDYKNYKYGLRSVPKNWAHNTFECSDPKCDIVGPGHEMLVLDSYLYNPLLKGFVFCKPCVEKHAIIGTKPLKCGSCNLAFNKNRKMAVIESKNLSKSAHHDGHNVYVCEYCASDGCYGPNYVFCRACQQYQHLNDFKRKDYCKTYACCNACLKKLKFCKKCDVYHFKSEKDANRHLSNGYKYPTGVRPLCNRGAKYKSSNLSDLIDRQFAILRHNKPKSMFLAY